MVAENPLDTSWVNPIRASETLGATVCFSYALICGKGCASNLTPCNVQRNAPELPIPLPSLRDRPRSCLSQFSIPRKSSTSRRRSSSAKRKCARPASRSRGNWSGCERSGQIPTSPTATCNATHLNCRFHSLHGANVPDRAQAKFSTLPVILPHRAAAHHQRSGSAHGLRRDLAGTGAVVSGSRKSMAECSCRLAGISTISPLPDTFTSDGQPQGNRQSGA